MGVVSNVNETNNEVEKRSKKWKGNLLFYLFYYFLFFPLYWRDLVTLSLSQQSNFICCCWSERVLGMFKKDFGSCYTFYFNLFYFYQENLSDSPCFIHTHSLTHWRNLSCIQTLMGHQHQCTSSKHSHLILRKKVFNGHCEIQRIWFHPSWKH